MFILFICFLFVFPLFSLQFAQFHKWLNEIYVFAIMLLRVSCVLSHPLAFCVVLDHITPLRTYNSVSLCLLRAHEHFPMFFPPIDHSYIPMRHDTLVCLAFRVTVFIFLRIFPLTLSFLQPTQRIFRGDAQLVFVCFI